MPPRKLGRPLPADPVARFVVLMNAEARRLGLRDTVYRTPHGLDEPGAHSSARDVLTLARAGHGLADLQRARAAAHRHHPRAPPAGEQHAAAALRRARRRQDGAHRPGRLEPRRERRSQRHAALRDPARRARRGAPRPRHRAPPRLGLRPLQARAARARGAVVRPRGRRAHRSPPGASRSRSIRASSVGERVVLPRRLDRRVQRGRAPRLRRAAQRARRDRPRSAGRRPRGRRPSRARAVAALAPDPEAVPGHPKIPARVRRAASRRACHVFDGHAQRSDRQDPARREPPDRPPAPLRAGRPAGGRQGHQRRARAARARPAGRRDRARRRPGRRHDRRGPDDAAGSCTSSCASPTSRARARSCSTPPGTHVATEVVEYGPVVRPDELEAFSSAYSYLLGGSDAVVLAGSLPREVPEDWYATALREARRQRVFTVLDSEGEPLRLGLGGEPDLVVPNQMEAEELVGFEFETTQDLVLALEQIVEMGARGVVITRDDGALALVREAGRPLLPARDDPAARGRLARRRGRRAAGGPARLAPRRAPVRRGAALCGGVRCRKHPARAARHARFPRGAAALGARRRGRARSRQA